MIGASSAHVQVGLELVVTAGEGSVHTWSMKYVFDVVHAGGKVARGVGPADYLASGEAEVVVGMPLVSEPPTSGPGVQGAGPRYMAPRSSGPSTVLGYLKKTPFFEGIEPVGLGDLQSA